MAIYHPLLGVGFGQFPENFETYATEIAGEYGQRTAHSTWILALAEGGWIGLFLLGSLYYVGAIRGAVRIFSEDPSWFFAAMSYGTAITFLSHTYLLFPYILIAIISSAEGIVTAKMPSRQDSILEAA